MAEYSFDVQKLYLEMFLADAEAFAMPRGGAAPSSSRRRDDTPPQLQQVPHDRAPDARACACRWSPHSHFQRLQPKVILLPRPPPPDAHCERHQFCRKQKPKLLFFERSPPRGGTLRDTGRDTLAPAAGYTGLPLA